MVIHEGESVGKFGFTIRDLVRIRVACRSGSYFTLYSGIRESMAGYLVADRHQIEGQEVAFLTAGGKGQDDILESVPCNTIKCLHCE